MNQPEIDSAFYAITENFELDATQLKEYAPADTEVYDLLTFYAAHLETVRDVDVHDADELFAAQNQLETLVWQDFKDFVDIKLGMGLIASGDAVAVVVDNETGAFDTNILADDVRLYGSFGDIVITELPLPAKIEHIVDTDGTFKLPAELTDKFRLAFEITDASIGPVDGEREYIPPTHTVLLPLDRPGLQLKREMS